MDARTNDSSSNSQPTNRWEWAFKLAPIFLVLVTGVFYLTGIAFHQGYLAHFHLLSSMFDDDAGSQVAFAVRGWQETANQLVRSTGHGLLYVALPLLAGGALAVAAVWRVERGRYQSRRALRAPGLRVNNDLRRRVQRRRASRARPHPFRNTPLARQMLLNTLVLMLALVLTYALVCSVATILGFLIWPFGYAGQALAEKDEAAGFSDAPSVTVTGPDGVKAAYKVIACAPRFCALYRHDRVVTVPASTVTWLINSAKPEASVVK
ncbi:hypothetical protein [Pinirhizobacter soli]|uniref:hypothetical protein n=1 Tax=Pinirhizobacter soli TaxID=2786953 RepID=UPI00202A169F|nr:hypothetical protein [Pinirhizobacter soli]